MFFASCPTQIRQAGTSTGQHENHLDYNLPTCDSYRTNTMYLPLRDIDFKN